ncbi:MAG: hypothetical protein Q8R18_01480 [bacterium]|nr:hypothetical protein [bacterium]
MVVAETQSLIILPAIAMGLVLGIYELYLLKGDEAFQGSHWFSHGLHIFPLLIIASFASFNIDLFQQMVGASLPALLENDIFLRVAIALIVTVKVYISSAVVPGASGRGMHESIIHCLIIGVLIGLSPFLWPFVEPVTPTWLGGSG